MQNECDETPLVHFVQESLALSGQSINIHSLGYLNYVQAASTVWHEGAERLVAVEEIHETLFPLILDEHGTEVSRWREVNAWVVDKDGGTISVWPHQLLETRLFEHHQLVNNAMMWSGDLTDSEKMQLADTLMIDALNTLYFKYGNRRCARLYLNALRLRLGLSWQQVDRKQQAWYDELSVGYGVAAVARMGS